MFIKKLLFCILLSCSFLGFAENPVWSPSSQISVLTCGAGDELYAAFGHTAIRVQDPVHDIDYVYNYGTFNFNQPGFYVNFVLGKPYFTLSRAPFPNFLYEYEYEKRWVKEQLLDLRPSEKIELLNFLSTNYRPENRGYLYDYLYNNCSTKIPEILKKVLGKNLVFKESHLKETYTFRELIHQNLNTNSWSSFGIDLALGSVIDQKATPNEHMFLPLYVMKQLNNTKLKGKPLVKRERTILNFADRIIPTYFLASPLFWLVILLLFVIIISYIDIKNNVRSHWLDFALFFVTGIIGLLLCFLWFLTDHSATAGNFNILWAFPLNGIAAFYLLRKKTLPSWMPKYILALLGLLILTLLFWMVGIQVFSPLILPILIALGIRYFLIYKKTRTALKTNKA
ncbi:lipoprotein N-acyltransferase Lnb domain-containing protein [Costertonia aggregata]|uniref:DUF4105 domain-containing protein n=1 Tax=Costertonia aggregata TaxID=343403 RepID=A0A7H9ASP7_9FLAO|nr:DUF4105 domain-containing protein [Costertonia aggregata]QLG46372.1 DUF4105 domain-containing protein [Costertonia aggregata]